MRSEIRVEFQGAMFDVEYYFAPGEPAGWDDPGSGDECDIIRIVEVKSGASADWIMDSELADKFDKVVTAAAAEHYASDFDDDFDIED